MATVLEPRGPAVEAVDDESRMRPTGRRETVLDPDVDLDSVAAESAAAPRRQRRRLRDLLEAERVPQKARAARSEPAGAESWT